MTRNGIGVGNPSRNSSTNPLTRNRRMPHT
ncbi:hypothetical protein CM00_gp89 [Mycobacterium phage Kugel]|uniref:Uncharacterized protein n=1 Tax=Mycobacterium phage Kugel TaxID=2923003 RepID=G8IBC7_9CAUD|nr:hypothetical protein CM00_gp89 [Mycobacterium phage Kugel]AER50025.1 hypothetical protein KUGEL_89 [Mycobacterium phage Kugel]